MSLIKRNRQGQDQIKEEGTGESKTRNGLISSEATKQTVEERRQTRYKKIQRSQRKNAQDLETSHQKECDDQSKFISRKNSQGNLIYAQAKAMRADEKKKLFDIRNSKKDLNKSHNILYPNDLKGRDFKPNESMNKSYDPNLDDLAKYDRKETDLIFNSQNTMPVVQLFNQ